jgi:hypothetical protein
MAFRRHDILRFLLLLVCGSCMAAGVAFSDWRTALSAEGYYYGGCGSGSLTLTTQSGSVIDLGWTGIGHHAPLSDGVSITADLDCDGAASTVCSIDGSSLVGTALGGPLPLSFGGVPMCVLASFADGTTGSYDCTSGCSDFSAELDVRVFLSQSADAPCPQCENDLVPNDGDRGGTCNGGATPGAFCDANALSASFGATSNDCLPAGSSVGEQPLSVQALTTTIAAVPTVDCLGEPADSDCYCPGQVAPNACTDGVCNESGVCENGPIDGTCSGAPYRQCRSGTGSEDCEDVFPGAGECVDQLRACFGSTIERSGECGIPTSTAVAVFCVAATRAAAINTIAGLPGPAAISIPLVAALAIPAGSPAPALTPTPVSTPAGNDADGDGVLDADDDCPNVPNPDQADLDGDDRGDVCDGEDAALVVRRGRVRRSNGHSGEIVVRGTAPFGPGAALDPTSGFVARIVDGATLDVTTAFGADECRARGGGDVVSCRSADRARQARFETTGASPTGYRFELTLRKLAIASPFVAPLVTTITTAPPVLETGLDRVGRIASCRETRNGLICR